MTKTKRKKLKNMSRTELIAYANSCPGVVLQPNMNMKQIVNAIPWKFKDHDGGEKAEAEPKTEAERLANLDAREAELDAREAAINEAAKNLNAGQQGAKNVIEEPIVPPLKNKSIIDAVKVKDNAELRRYISMDGQYRYGLSDEQKERADRIIEKIGCSKPVPREKAPVKTGF